MSQNTILVSPIPPSTTIDKIKETFSAFSVKNIHIDGNKAYVEFADQGDLQNLDIQFDNYEVADLNNAKIDKADFDWNSIQKQTSNFSELKSQSSSDKHHDLMAADIENLIVIENCDQQKLKSLSSEAIRQIFKDFHSVNRIVKRNNDVIVEFTDGGQMEKLQAIFNNLHVPQLGYNSQIQKADNYKITAQDFVNLWSKTHNQSMVTQQSTNLGYKEGKQQSDEFLSGNKLGYGSIQEKASPVHKVLHEDIIPPFDKKTSMEVNFLNEQTQLGYKDEPKHQVIPQATTHQELDYTTEIKINENEHGLGYSKQVEEQAHRRQEEQRKKKQEEEKQRKILQEQQKAEQLRKKQQEEERRRKIELQQQQRKAEQEQRLKEQQEQQRRKRQEEQNRKKKQQQTQRKRQQQQRKKQQQEERRKKQQEQQRKRQEEEQKKREQEERRKRQEEKKKKLQQERLSKQLKEKLDAQKTKFESEIQKLGYQQEPKKQEKHQIPTESENAAQEVEAIKQVGQSIQKQLGYAVNMAKAESANLLQTGLDLLKQATGTEKTMQKIVPPKKIEELGYKKEEPKQIGLNLINSGLGFLKGSYQKFQQHFGQNAQQRSKISELGYEKWSVKPDVSGIQPAKAAQSRILRTLVTVSLLIWVIFLLMQDTSEEVSITNEIEIPSSTI